MIRSLPTAVILKSLALFYMDHLHERILSASNHNYGGFRHFKNVQNLCFQITVLGKIGKYILIFFFFFFVNLVVLRYGNGCAYVGVGNGVVE
jgi:hypothetical protein